MAVQHQLGNRRQGHLLGVDNLIGSTLQRGPNFELFQLVENYDDYADILRNLNFVENFVTVRARLAWA